MNYCKKKTAIIILLITAAFFPFFVSGQVDGSMAYEAVITADNILEIEFHIPEGFYQSADDEIFGFSFTQANKDAVTDIVYPEAELSDGHLIYTGDVTLSVILDKDDFFSGEAVEITAFYQLCSFGGSCFFPRVETFTVFRE